MIDTICEARELLGKLDMGQMNGVAYDTAWVARLKDSNGKPLFPRSLRWLLANQRADGSWGGSIEYYHDRIISTISAVNMLATKKNPKYDEYIKKGVNYLNTKLQTPDKIHIETVAFELLLPTLLDESAQIGLDIDSPSEECMKMRDNKLKLVPEHLIYSVKTPLMFSMEFLGDSIDTTKIKNTQLSNGSIGVSVSATAYMLSKIHDRHGYEFLVQVQKKRRLVSALS